MKSNSFPGPLSLVRLSLVVITCGLLCASPSALPAAEAPITAKSAFGQLKSLAGEWHGKANHGDTATDATVIYRVIGGGSAVMETLFPGTPHEMVTMYHLDGDKLMLTHYCSAGNQPRMVLDLQKSTARLLVFDFAGGTNLDPVKDPHMHTARITLADAADLEAEWDSYRNGQKAGSAKFKLKRETPKK